MPSTIFCSHNSCFSLWRELGGRFRVFLRSFFIVNILFTNVRIKEALNWRRIQCKDQRYVTYIVVPIGTQVNERTIDFNLLNSTNISTLSAWSSNSRMYRIFKLFIQFSWLLEILPFSFGQYSHYYCIWALGLIYVSFVLSKSYVKIIVYNKRFILKQNRRPVSIIFWDFSANYRNFMLRSNDQCESLFNIFLDHLENLYFFIIGMFRKTVKFKT
jgi:hypothetical protein